MISGESCHLGKWVNMAGRPIISMPKSEKGEWHGEPLARLCNYPRECEYKNTFQRRRYGCYESFTRVCGDPFEAPSGSLTRLSHFFGGGRGMRATGMPTWLGHMRRRREDADHLYVEAAARFKKDESTSAGKPDADDLGRAQ